MPMNPVNKYKYTYRVYGLIIKSELELEELISVDTPQDVEADIYIEYGDVPRRIENPIFDCGITQANSKELYFYISSAAHFYICNGNKIIIEPDKETNFEKQKIYLLGGALGMVLTQRDMIGIHGAALVVDGTGIIITGRAGTGKSTLSTALRLRNHLFLADDVSAIGSDENNNIIIFPAFPRQKLCGDTLEKLSLLVNEYKLVDVQRDKYSIPINKGFYIEPTLLTAIFYLDIEDVENVSIRELKGREKLNAILENIYGMELNQFIGISAVSFKKALDIANKSIVYKVTRPKLGNTLDILIETVEESVNQLQNKQLSS